MTLFSKTDLETRPIQRFTWILFFWLSLFFFLVYLKKFLAPLALGALLAFLFYPIANFLEKKGLHRIPSNLISILFGISVVYAVLLFLYKKMTLFMGDLPQSINTIQYKINLVNTALESNFGFKIAVTEQDLEEFLHDKRANLLSGTTHTVYTVLIMPVYIFMFLFYRNKFEQFFELLYKDDKRREIKPLLRNVATVMTKYTSGMFTVVCILCFINSLGLYIIGLKFALLLGTIAAICNFIPYFGTIIGFLFPFTFALLTYPEPNIAVAVFFLFVLVQLLENNILTPNIVGGKLRLSAFSVIIGVTLGGFVWGIVGMFISIPALAIIKLIFENSDKDHPWAYLLSDSGTEHYAITLRSIKNWIQKNNTA